MPPFLPWLIAAVLSFFGVVKMVLPTRLLLAFDRRTGYWLYKSAPDEATGLRRAKWFYRLFGLAFVLFPIGFMVKVW